MTTARDADVGVVDVPDRSRFEIGPWPDEFEAGDTPARELGGTDVFVVHGHDHAPA